MIKLQTPVVRTPCRVGVSYGDRILLLGSCFADSIGKTLTDCGFDALVNPFGTLYNPASICLAVRRLVSGREFTPADCVPMGSVPKADAVIGNGPKDDARAGSVAMAEAGRICSFSHHTAFARLDAAAFLENANASLRSAAAFFRGCNKVILTLGTAWCFRYVGGGVSGREVDPSNVGRIVSNCLKRDAKEFSREMMDIKGCAALLRNIVTLCAGKEIIFTVSPIRHLADGAHGNQISKSTLLMAVNELCPETDCPAGLDYFPAYEIMMDELRDYRFYAEDMVHPSAQAVGYIAERFFDRHLSPADKPLLEERVRAFKRSLHRPCSDASSPHLFLGRLGR